jgi:glycosyltransferase involved in cell wall biosynthesis
VTIDDFSQTTIIIMQNNGGRYRNIPLFETTTPPSNVNTTTIIQPVVFNKSQQQQQPFKFVEPIVTPSSTSSSFSSSPLVNHNAVHYRVRQTPTTPVTPITTTTTKPMLPLHNNTTTTTNHNTPFKTKKPRYCLRRIILFLICCIPLVLLYYAFHREQLLDNFYKIHFDKRLQERQLQSAAQLASKHIIHDYFDNVQKEEKLEEKNQITIMDDSTELVNSQLHPLMSEIYVYSHILNSGEAGRIIRNIKNIMKNNEGAGKDSKREIVIVVLDRPSDTNNSTRAIAMNLANSLAEHILKRDVRLLYCRTCPSEVSALALAYRVARGKFWDITLNDKQLYRHIGSSIFQLLGTTFMPHGAFDITLLVKDHFNKHLLLQAYQAWNIFTESDSFKDHVKQSIPLSFDAVVQSVHTLEESQQKKLLTPMLTSMGLQRNLILLHGRNIEESGRRQALSFRGKKDLDTCLVVWYDIHELNTIERDLIYKHHTILGNADLVITNAAALSMRARMFVDYVFTVDDKSSLAAVLATAITFCDAHLFEHEQKSKSEEVVPDLQPEKPAAPTSMPVVHDFNIRDYVLDSVLMPFSTGVPERGAPEGLPLIIALQVEHFHSYGDLERSVFNMAKAIHQDMKFKVVLINCGIKGEPFFDLVKLGINAYTLDSEATHSNADRLKQYQDIIKRENIHVVNAHYSVFGVSVLEELKVPLVQTIDSHYMWLFEERFFDLLSAFRAADRYTSLYICSTSNVAMYADLALRLNPDKMVIVHKGVDEEEVTLPDKVAKQCAGPTFRKEFNLEVDDLVLILPSTIAPIKGQHFVIKALEKMISEPKKIGAGIVPQQQIKLLLVGDAITAKYKKKIKDLVDNSKYLKNNVIFTGPRSDIPCLLHMSDVYIHASLLEGYCPSVTEALYFDHLDLVVSNTGGADELITSIYGHSYNRTLNQLEQSNCRMMRNNRQTQRRFVIVDLPYQSLLDKSLDMSKLPSDPNEDYIDQLAKSISRVADCAYSRKKFFAEKHKSDEEKKAGTRVSKLQNSFVYKAHTTLFQWLDSSIRPYLRSQFSL